MFGKKKKVEERPNPIKRDGRFRIAVAGAGYVGLSVGTLLARNNDVVLVDVIPAKTEAINAWMSPINDAGIVAAFTAAATGEAPLALRATFDPVAAYTMADIVIIATPTGYLGDADRFDASSVEATCQVVRSVNADCWIVIRSTVPVGYTEGLRARTGDDRIVVSPDFLREGLALIDNLHPTRVVVGVDQADASSVEFGGFFAALLAESADRPMQDIPQMICGSSGAEAIKVFSDAYLAQRTAFFNELDTYASVRGLNRVQLIEGLCLDPRIGPYYNNPSFGHASTVLPKDGKQLLADYGDVPHEFLAATVRAGDARKDAVANEVYALLRERCGFGTGVHPVVGVYRLANKGMTDDIRGSATIDVVRRLRDKGVDVVIYEPSVPGAEFDGIEVVPTLEELKERSALILANRYSADLEDVRDRVYTRDLFGRD